LLLVVGLFAGVINCGLKGTFTFGFAAASTRGAGFSDGTGTGAAGSVATTRGAPRSTRYELTTREPNLRPTKGLAVSANEGAMGFVSD
jgi:hypothetical protein